MSFPAFTQKEIYFLPNSTMKMFSLSGEVIHNLLRKTCGGGVCSIYLNLPKMTIFFQKIHGGYIFIRLYLY